MEFVDYAVLVIFCGLGLVILAAFIASRKSKDEKPEKFIEKKNENPPVDTEINQDIDCQKGAGIAVDIIKEFEGFKANEYLDLAGIRTIGWGTTNFDKNIKKVTKQEAEAYLNRDISIILNDLRKIIKVPLNHNQWAALISFVYNVGITAFKHSTLLKLINAQKNIYEIETEFMKWKHVGKKVVEGLVNRRRKEFLLFSKKAL